MMGRQKFRRKAAVPYWGGDDGSEKFSMKQIQLPGPSNWQLRCAPPPA